MIKECDKAGAGKVWATGGDSESHLLLLGGRGLRLKALPLRRGLCGEALPLLGLLEGGAGRWREAAIEAS